MVREFADGDDDGRGPASRWSRGWKFLAGAVLVVLIGVTAFAVVAAALVSKMPASKTPALRLTQAEATRASSADSTRSGVVAGTVAAVHGPAFTSP